MNLQPFQIKIEKPWGFEIIFTPPESPTVSKLIHLNKGSRFSLQYHEQKDETLILISGKAKIIFGKSKENLIQEEMKTFFGYFIPHGLIHRCQAIEECDIIESSTKETGATIRLEDDYSRGNETEEERKKTREKLIKNYFSQNSAHDQTE